MQMRHLHGEHRPPVPQAASVMMALMSETDDLDALMDDGGDVQRQHLRAAGVLISKDSPLIPTTSVVVHDIDGNPVVVASLLVAVRHGGGNAAQRIIAWLRSTADLIEAPTDA